MLLMLATASLRRPEGGNRVVGLQRRQQRRRVKFRPTRRLLRRLWRRRRLLLGVRKMGPVQIATSARESAREDGEGGQEEGGAAQEAAQGAVQDAFSGTVPRNGARKCHHRTRILQVEGSWPLLLVVTRLWERGAEVGAMGRSCCELQHISRPCLYARERSPLNPRKRRGRRKSVWWLGWSYSRRSPCLVHVFYLGQRSFLTFFSVC